MKHLIWILAATWQLASLSGLAGVAYDIDGATPGRWTMDFEAAKNVAAEKQLPILLDFSGSDWCGWCKVMEENIFTKPEWKAYATNHLVMVLVDFPSDKSLVPDKYVERNNALKTEYGVRGFPTFVVLDDDGNTELGRLRSGRDKTSESFQGELQNLFRLRSVEIEKYCATLGSEGQKSYRTLIEDLAAEKVLLKQAKKEVTEASHKVQTVGKSVEKLEGELLTFEMRNLIKNAGKQWFHDNFDDGSWEKNWGSFTNGCSIQEKDGVLQISGTFLEGGWKGNGLHLKKKLEADNFSASVKFSAPKFEGENDKLIWLNVKGEGGRECGIYCSPEYGYRLMKGWPKEFSGFKECFGDEKEEFHELKIIYSSEPNRAVGFVDGERVGDLPVSLTGELEFVIYVNTGASGAEADVVFDDFKVYSF